LQSGALCLIIIILVIISASFLYSFKKAALIPFEEMRVLAGWL